MPFLLTIVLLCSLFLQKKAFKAAQEKASDWYSVFWHETEGDESYHPKLSYECLNYLIEFCLKDALLLLHKGVQIFAYIDIRMPGILEFDHT